MPKNKEYQQLLFDENSYSIKVEGEPALLRADTITHDDLVVGDKVTMYHLVDGKYFLFKSTAEDDLALTISKISISHICFENIDVNVE